MSRIWVHLKGSYLCRGISLQSFAFRSKSSNVANRCNSFNNIPFKLLLSRYANMSLLCMIAILFYKGIELTWSRSNLHRFRKRVKPTVKPSFCSSFLDLLPGVRLNKISGTRWMCASRCTQWKPLDDASIAFSPVCYVDSQIRSDLKGCVDFDWLREEARRQSQYV